MYVCLDDLKIAVVIPCLNEEAGIAKVISDAKKYLPYSEVYVYDNDSEDRTASVAIENGASVSFVKQRGKASVVKKMFAEIDADFYVMVDGDGTYELSTIRENIKKLVDSSGDMLVGRRIHRSKNAYRPGHLLGNKLFSKFVSLLFPGLHGDVFSGYRILSRAFVKSFAIQSKGFAIETEMNLHASALSIHVVEVDVEYNERELGSESKLSTYRDGLRILKLIISMLTTERGMFFYGWLSFILGSLSIISLIPVLSEFFSTGLVPRLPTYITSVVGIAVSLLTLLVGIIVNVIGITRREAKILQFIAYSKRVL